MSYKIIEELLNKKIIGFERSEELKLFTNDGYFHFYHDQDCCEYVTLEDVCGDLNDLKDEVIIKAESVTNRNDPAPETEYLDDSYTWTFFKLGTIKGEVTLRFFGTSNGYYSEDIDIDFISKNGKCTKIYNSGFDL